MSQITEIKVAKGKKSRRHIYLDDGFACTLDEFTVFKHKLKVGQEITITDLEQITFESEAGVAFELAVNLISKTPKTRKQIYEYLRSKGYLPKLCNNAIDKLAEYHYVDDEQFARMYANTYCGKYGKSKIRFMLASKGIPPQTIEAVIAEMSPQDDTIYEFAKKYMKNKEFDNQNYAKLCRYLSGKGFDWTEISEAIGRLKEERNEDGY